MTPLADKRKSVNSLHFLRESGILTAELRPGWPCEFPLMTHDMICGWLGLPPGNWPPDHYTLLGLPPGEGNPERIDQEVHARLAKLRCYQISHPELATQAMNRLAQAFLCLTDPSAKKAYDCEIKIT